MQRAESLLSIQLAAYIWMYTHACDSDIPHRIHRNSLHNWRLHCGGFGQPKCLELLVQPGTQTLGYRVRCCFICCLDAEFYTGAFCQKPPSPGNIIFHFVDRHVFACSVGCHCHRLREQALWKAASADGRFQWTNACITRDNRLT